MKKFTKWIPLVMVNIMLVMMIIGSTTANRITSVFSKFGSNWPEVEVYIDDIEAELDYTEEVGGKTRYYYEVDRQLSYVYDGETYTREDEIEFYVTEDEYPYELKKGYQDKYTYKVNPASPRSMSRSYSSLDDPKVYETIKLVSFWIPIVLLVLINGIVLIVSLSKRKKIFEQ